MNDVPNAWSHGAGPASAALACVEVDAALPDYLAGRLDETAAEAVETHAASCARCEALLERGSREALDAVASVAAFAPPLPPTLRAETMAAVARATPPGGRATARAWRRWGGAGSALLAAAAVLVVVVRVHGTDAGALPDALSGTASRATARLADGAGQVVADSGPVANEPLMAPVMRRAARLAGEPAQGEFQALDAAAAELEAALEAAPDDATLRDGLASVRARRAELTRQVREAAS